MIYNSETLLNPKYLLTRSHKIGSLGVHNSMHETGDWTSFKIISPLKMGCWLVLNDRYAWHCVRQGCRILSKCKQKVLLLIDGSPRTDLNIQPNISNERKQIFDFIYNLLYLCRGYTLRVMIELIHRKVTSCAHCILWNY